MNKENQYWSVQIDSEGWTDCFKSGFRSMTFAEGEWDALQEIHPNDVLIYYSYNQRNDRVLMILGAVRVMGTVYRDKELEKEVTHSPLPHGDRASCNVAIK